jgi:hypothetical protein
VVGMLEGARPPAASGSPMESGSAVALLRV